MKGKVRLPREERSMGVWEEFPCKRKGWGALLGRTWEGGGFVLKRGQRGQTSRGGGVKVLENPEQKKQAVGTSGAQGTPERGAVGVCCVKSKRRAPGGFGGIGEVL